MSNLDNNYCVTHSVEARCSEYRDVHDFTSSAATRSCHKKDTPHLEIHFLLLPELERMSINYDRTEDFRELSAIKSQKRDQRNLSYRCSICLNMDRESWKEKTGRGFCYSDACDAATKGCRVCHCICAILRYYFCYDNVKPNEPRDHVGVKFSPGWPIMLQSYLSPMKAIMVYAAPGK
jgi:hypothetical protein